MEIKDYALLLAIDSPREKEILRLLSSLKGLVDGVKIGAASLLACGIEVVKKMKEMSDLPIAADLKVADIGFMNPGAVGSASRWSGTNSRIIEVAIGGGIDYVICHTIVGTSSIRECIDVAHGLGGKVLTLPYMTHKGAELFFDQPIDTRRTSSWLDNESPKAGRALRKLGRKKSRGRVGAPGHSLCPT